MLSLGAAGSAANRGGTSKAAAPTTLVYAGAADPTFLDPALDSDGESFRITTQIFEGLVQLKPGSTSIKPDLATSWSINKTGKVWTFNLRHGVSFTDGTPFNAKAVCYNFNRWYNFSGAFQNAGATYYYQAVFGGFHHNEVSTLGAPVYKSCNAVGSYKALITLTKKYGPFLPALSLSSFSMQSPAALKKYNADQATINNGAFVPTGTYAFQHPTGTGPFKFSHWVVKQKVTLVRNDTYWGPKSKLKQVIVVPIADNSARVQALQTGEVNAMDLLQPTDVSTVQNNSNLKTESRPAFNVAYVTINQAQPPFDKLAVRQAVAYGLNRQAVVNNFAIYGGRAQVANEFMPPSLFGYSKNVTKYSYDPAKAKQLLQSAGLTLPVSVDFYYPTGVSRPYMPDPQAIFQIFQNSLNDSGFKVIPHSLPWRPDYVAAVDSGKAGALNMIGWTGDYGDPDDFLGVFFKGANPQWGFNNPALTALLNKGASETDFNKRVAIYQQANNMIMKDVLPGVPYAHTRPALGFQKQVKGYITSPAGTEPFAPVYFGGV